MSEPHPFDAAGEDPRLRRWAAAASLLLVALLFAIGRSGPELSLQWLSDNLQLTLALLAFLAAARAAAQERSTGRAFWLSIALGALLWASAQAIWTWYGRSLGDRRTLEASDVLFFVAAVPFLLAAVIRPDRGRRSHLGLAFDTSLVCAFVLHAFVYGAVAYMLTGDVVTYDRFCVRFMHARGLVVVAAFAALVWSSSGPWRRVYWQLLAALLVFHVGDAVALEAEISGRYQHGLYDLAWTLPFLWIAFSALTWRGAPAAPAQGDDDLAWADIRKGTVLALLAVVSIPTLHVITMYAGTDTPALLRLRMQLTLVTTTVVATLFLLRQLHLLRRLEARQQQRERALLHSERQFKTVFHASPAAMSISTPGGRIVDVNERYTALLGYSRDELVGQSATGLGLWVDPLEREALVVALSQQSSVRDLTLRFRRKTGEVREVVGAYEKVDLAGQVCLLGLFEDVTDRTRLEARLQQSQKMEAVGRLAGGVAHDFNNLLTVILGYGSIVLEGLAHDDPLRPAAVEIERAGGRAALLTKQLLLFSRKQAVSPEVLDLGAVIADMQGMLARLIGEHIEVVTRIDPALGRVRADSGQIEQIVMNLVVNARDAMPGGGTLTVEAHDADDAMGSWVVLTVRDTGVGMDATVKAHLFEPFFTTKTKGQGTGLGLATVYGLVRQAGGHIQVESEPGAGTVFEVRLPRVEAPVAIAQAIAAEPVSGGGEVVLVVEDEEAVLNLAADVLAANGYRVLRARSGVDALRIGHEHQGAIQLVLTDVVMPGMSGPQLAERLLLTRPGTRVLYASGHGEDVVAEQDAGDAEFIQKPFMPAALSRRVREVLDKARPQVSG